MPRENIKITPLIDVAVGIVINSQSEILIAKRQDNKFQGGLWEFPGGKVEAGESAADALIRELQEEVNITPLSFYSLLQVKHYYAEKAFLLQVFLVDKFSGIMQPKEQQIVKWVSLREIKARDFPEANHIILEKLCAIIEQTKA